MCRDDDDDGGGPAAGARMEEEFGVVFAAFISPLAVGGNAFTIDENAKRQWSWFLHVGRSNAMHRRAREVDRWAGHGQETVHPILSGLPIIEFPTKDRRMTNLPLRLHVEVTALPPFSHKLHVEGTTDLDSTWKAPPISTPRGGDLLAHSRLRPRGVRVGGGHKSHTQHFQGS